MSATDNINCLEIPTTPQPLRSSVGQEHKLHTPMGS